MNKKVVEFIRELEEFEDKLDKFNEEFATNLEEIISSTGDETIYLQGVLKLVAEKTKNMKDTLNSINCQVFEDKDKKEIGRFTVKKITRKSPSYDYKRVWNVLEENGYKKEDFLKKYTVSTYLDFKVK